MPARITKITSWVTGRANTMPSSETALDERAAERETDRQAEQRPEDRDDHGLVADHRAHLRARHPDGAEQASSRVRS